MNGLIVGRFQPFHRGHLRAIDYCLSKVDNLWIGVGSANQTPTQENPFTAEERMYMIRISLGTRKDRCKIIKLDDKDNNEEWVSNIDDEINSHFATISNHYDKVFSGNPFTISVFEQAGKEVEEFDLFDRDNHSGTNVRQLIKDCDHKWENLVPMNVREYLIQIGASKRLQKLG